MLSREQGKLLQRQVLRRAVLSESVLSDPEWSLLFNSGGGMLRPRVALLR